MYNPKSIEPKWQKSWQDAKVFRTNNPVTDADFQVPKYYALDMFPYPSGAGLHVGHPKGYIATDAVSRYKHAKGFRVLHPMGWDAFGLPAENYAIKTGVHPKITTDENIANFKRQLQALGLSFDWDREIATTDPKYYKWTQWIFLKLFEAGLAYEQDLPINYCPSCKTGLANEEVVGDNICDRCSTKVERRKIRQWVLAITKYAERLLADVDGLDWPEGIKEMQRNWIGKSEGVEFEMKKTFSPIEKGGQGGLDTKPPLALILHGWEDEKGINRHWQPWLKSNLEMLGYEVAMPDLPNPHEPDLEKQLAFLEQYKERLTEDSVVIGHSMGGFLAMHFVERLDKRIGKLVCVAPIFNGLIDHVDWSNEINGWEVGSASMKIGYDPDKIKRNTKSWDVFLSKNDKSILYHCAKEHFDNIWVSHTDIEDAGHFCERDWYAVFPQLLETLSSSIAVYTTRIDTVYGMTYVVLAADHKDVESWITPEQKDACEAYIAEAKNKSDQDRTNEGKEKTGVFTGSYVVNPFNNEKIPVWIGDYVLGSYGTGAVMAVPAHDERDFEFAKKMGLEIRKSVLTPEEHERLAVLQEELKSSSDAKKIGEIESIATVHECFTDDGMAILSNDPILSDPFTLPSEEARQHLAKIAENNGFGRKKTNYKLRDWLFSRQRYWGEPIPLIHIANEDYEKLPSITEKEGIPYITLTGASAPKSHDAVQCFHPACALIRHWDEDRYIVLTFKGWDKGFVGWTVEDGETDEQAVIRETQEETGYKNIRIEKVIIRDIYSREYKARKGIEQEAREPVYLLQILNDERVDMPVEEWITHVEWVETDKVAEQITFDHHRFYWDYFQQEKFAYRVQKDYGEYLYISGKEISKIHDGLYGKIICDYNLPLELPEVTNYEPAGDGNSPLALVPEFVNVRIADNLTGKRETNTMPQWAGSCWYYLRFMDPTNDEYLVDPKLAEYWGQVDSYVGGAEHAVLHLLYARFWHKFLFDIGVVPTKEPFQSLHNQGMILAYAYERENGGLVASDCVEERDGKFYETTTGKEVKKIVAKMSKSLKNVVNPDAVIEEYGTDTFRLYEMSMSDFRDSAPWNTEAIIGVRRFLERAHTIFETPRFAADDMKAMKLLHKTIKKVGEDIEAFKFNTAISALMILLNEGLPRDEESQVEWKETFAILLHPFAPHLAEELYYMLCKGNHRKAEDFTEENSPSNWRGADEGGGVVSVFNAPWPEYQDFMLVDDEVTIAVQINGKIRGTFTFLNGVAQEEVAARVMEDPSIAKWLEGMTIVREIFVPNKLYGIVAK